MAGRATPGLRYALRDNELAVHRLEGGTERRVLGGAAELRAALEGPLGLTLPEDTGLMDALTRLVTSPG